MATALVTGAAGGIGLATVQALADAGWQVIATVRNPKTCDDLRAVADGQPVEIRQLDVTSQESVDSCVAAVLADSGAVDLLVNNAGTGHRGTLEQLPLSDFAACFEVNFYGVARVTKALLPSMRAAGSGRVITVTSMNGILAMPFSDAYNAAKFAVEGLMEGLAPVLREFGIAVSVIEPGPVSTGFLRNARGRLAKAAADDPYGELLDGYNATMAGLLNTGQTPAEVAQVIADIAADPQPRLRYQSSAAATGMVGRKLVDPTGDSIVAGTSAFLHGGPGPG